MSIAPYPTNLVIASTLFAVFVIFFFGIARTLHEAARAETTHARQFIVLFGILVTAMSIVLVVISARP